MLIQERYYLKSSLRTDYRIYATYVSTRTSRKNVAGVQVLPLRRLAVLIRDVSGHPLYCVLCYVKCHIVV